MNPQLIEIATTPGVFRATFTAVIRPFQGLRAGFHHQDVGGRCDGMSPLDIERFLECPAIVGLVARQVVHGQSRVGQSISLVERLQVRSEVRVVIGLDQGDGLARAVARRPTIRSAT